MTELSMMADYICEKCGGKQDGHWRAMAEGQQLPFGYAIVPDEDAL